MHSRLFASFIHQAFVLPDGYEVDDPSLDTIRAVLHPSFTRADIARLDGDPAWSRALDGSAFAPGVVGLNNLGGTDAANVTVQALARVGPLRDWCLTQGGAGTAPLPPLAAAFSELVKKMWNPRAFKGHASPHEFLVACGAVAVRYVSRGCDILCRAKQAESRPNLAAQWVVIRSVQAALARLVSTAARSGRNCTKGASTPAWISA